MRKLVLAVILAFILLAPAGLVIAAEESPYPTITVIFSDGKVYDIPGKMWGATIIPYIEGRIQDYKWQEDADRAKYIFFDYSLKGLNPFGMDFINAIEKSTYDEFQNNVFEVLGFALNYTENMDSDGDGYTNIVELNNGTYPGDPKSYPGVNEKGFWEENEGYIILGILIASIFVLYFVFNKESEKERI